MKNKKTVVILLICLSCSLMSGCWDRVEIDKKVFVSTIGIDLGKEIGKSDELKKIKADEPFGERQIKKINVTYGFPDVSELGPGKAGTAKEKSINIEAYSMQDAIVQSSAKSSRDMHLGHTKLLLISDSILGYPQVSKEIIDYLQRQPQINKMMQVIVVKGKAEDYIKYKPDMEQNIEAYIAGLMENSSRNSTILPVTLNEFLRILNENGNAILPSIDFDRDKNELYLSGIAMIKDYQLKGYLNPIETSDLEILRGNLKGGKKVIYKEGHPIDFNIDGITRKIKMRSTEGKLVFDVNVELEGEVKGYYFGNSIFANGNLEEMQNNFNRALSEECVKIVKITQEEFGIDPIGFRENVEKYHPRVWNKIQDKWDESYKSAVINVNVDTKIRRIGVSQ